MNMTEKEILEAANYCIYKGYDYETMKYCDHMYGHEKFMDSVWEYVEECKEIGTIAFDKKYNN